MRTLVSISLAISVSLFVSIASTIPVQAIESFGIGAVPANPRADNPRTKSIFVYEAEPGKTVQDAVKIINNSSTTKTINVYPVDSQNSSDGAFACAQAADERKAVGNWIKLEKNVVTLQPGTNEKIPFTLTVPPNTSVGEHNGCIAIQDASTSATTKTENGIVLSFRSALRVAVTIPGEIVTKLSLVDVKTEQPNKKIQISPILKNTGNVSLDAKIGIELKSVFGTTTAATNGQFPVLTGSTSRFNFEIDKPFWGGWYQQVVTANYLPLADAGNANKKVNLDTQKRWVFVSPQPTALGIQVGLLIVVIASALYIFKRKQYIKELRSNTSVYKVHEGDNIQSVAVAHDISWKQLAKINGLKQPYTLKAGSSLHVPGKRAKQKKPAERK